MLYRKCKISVFYWTLPYHALHTFLVISNEDDRCSLKATSTSTRICCVATTVFCLFNAYITMSLRFSRYSSRKLWMHAKSRFLAVHRVPSIQWEVQPANSSMIVWTQLHQYTISLTARSERIWTLNRPSASFDLLLSRINKAFPWFIHKIKKRQGWDTEWTLVLATVECSQLLNLKSTLKNPTREVLKRSPRKRNMKRSV